MAAYRNGIQTVLIPADNAKDLEEIDQTVRQALQFILVERADQVLAAALLPQAEQTEASPSGLWEEKPEPSAPVVLPAAKRTRVTQVRQ